MKRLIQMGIALVTLAGTLALVAAALAVNAQDDVTCSVDSVAGRVSEAYSAYEDQAASAGDMESALSGMDALTSQISTIYAECDEARYQAYVEEGTALLEDLRGGGYIIYVRHAATDSTQQDTDLASCETQRNLSDKGRADAAKIGEAWTSLSVPVGEVISTEYCRTRETAEMAFGEPEVMQKADLEVSLGTLLAITPEDGMNSIIVGHVDLLETATGIAIPEDIRFNEGDALVYRPLGGPMGDQGYELLTRISLRNWFDLARITAEAGM